METKQIHQTETTLVQIGSRVQIYLNDQPQTWQIVAMGQSDIAQGKIASDAPLANFLLGLEVGEKKTGKINNRPVVIKVSKIF